MVGPVGLGLGILGSVLTAVNGAPIFLLLLLIGVLTVVASIPGHHLVKPNGGLVLILFGRYQGTVNRAGWHWTNPFTRLESRKISTRVHNFITSVSKVDDAEGNPIEIAAVVVWRRPESGRQPCSSRANMTLARS